MRKRRLRRAVRPLHDTRWCLDTPVSMHNHAIQCNFIRYPAFDMIAWRSDDRSCAGHPDRPSSSNSNLTHADYLVRPWQPVASQFQGSRGHVYAHGSFSQPPTRGLHGTAPADSGWATPSVRQRGTASPPPRSIPTAPVSQPRRLPRPGGGDCHDPAPGQRTSVQLSGARRSVRSAATCAPLPAWRHHPARQMTSERL